MKHATEATAFAPASVANVAVGFDILGFAFDVAGDRVTARTSPVSGVRVAAIHGPGAELLPLDPARNTAAVAVSALLRKLGSSAGFELEIEKGIAMGSGMGGSAASAVAAVVAANALLPQPLPKSELLDCAIEGEAAASGGRHADNVAPCLFGGLVLVRETDPVDVVCIPIPAGLFCVLAHPHAVVQTKEARRILQPSTPLHEWTSQSAQLGAFVSACHTGDLALLRRSFQDRIVGPQRAHLIPQFSEARKAAVAAGAMGLAISGSGPSVFALAEDRPTAERIVAALRDVYRRAGVEAELWSSPMQAPGARVLEGGRPE